MKKRIFFQLQQLEFASIDFIEFVNKAIATAALTSELLFNYQQFSLFGLGDQTSIWELKKKKVFF